jgi:hypothetical protein
MPHSSRRRRCERIDGRAWTIRSDSVVASATPDLHQEMLGLTK